MAAKVANFEEVLAEVRRRLRVKEDLDEPRPLEQLILLVLAQGVPLRRARAAMKRLQDSYVDWNEVRVSSVYEIRAILEPLGPRGIGTKAEQLRELLSTAYTRFNKLQLDFLTAGPLDADRTRRLDRFVKYLMTSLCPDEKAEKNASKKGATKAAPKTKAAAKTTPTAEAPAKRSGTEKAAAKKTASKVAKKKAPTPRPKAAKKATRKKTTRRA